jgi:hypothetical protein
LTGRPVFQGQQLLARHCERSEAILFSPHARRDGLLRGACHRERIRATSRLAMTTFNPIESMRNLRMQCEL